MYRPFEHTATSRAMDCATFAVYHDDDHFDAGNLAEQASETSSQSSGVINLHDPLHPLLVGSFVAAWGGPEEPTAQMHEDEDLPSPWGEHRLSPTSRSQSRELQQTTDIVRAQTPVSFEEEKVGCPGFGYTFGDEVDCGQDGLRPETLHTKTPASEFWVNKTESGYAPQCGDLHPDRILENRHISHWEMQCVLSRRGPGSMTAEQIEYYQQKVDNWWYGMLPVSQAVDDAVAQTSGTKPYKSEFLSASPLVDWLAGIGSELMPVRLAQNPGPPSLSNASQGKKVDSRRENLSQTQFVIDSWTTSTRDNECTIIVRSSGAVFYLQCIPAELEAEPILLADFYKSLKILKTNEHEDDVGDEGYDARRAEAEKLAQPFNEIISALAPDPPMPPITLHQWLNPEWFLLIATADEGKIRPRRDYENPYLPPGEYRQSRLWKSLDLDKWVPNWYLARDVQIISANPGENPLLSPPSKVFVQGDVTCHFKGFERGFPAVFRELRTFRKISDALATGQIPSDMRICRLQGVVCDVDVDTPNQTRITGLLLVYIEPKITPAPSTLMNIARSTNQETRKRWAKELGTTVQTLHKAGIQWGDAKPDNILVDKNDDLWLIDFDGGYTRTWRKVTLKDWIRFKFGFVTWVEDLFQRRTEAMKLFVFFKS
ncbi:uncharacterized protein PpBr36_05822 [Pyricularia pennisetigena]|uniref:uncharacterized protein n=1 Tax=Pyricularia pennisetigena TaxID=1578925 RepID=UPI001151FB88|nr:uncharacterized protein PpBr36_05822 [Pyricularia pennisetigena]TLS23145.1 hypothetical protein PpBr36_05822 [Pyricularia pennisetigena]